jgi:hypothetical protein
MTGYYKLPPLTEGQYRTLMACLGFCIEDLQETGGFLDIKEPYPIQDLKRVAALDAHIQETTAVARTPCEHTEYRDGHCGNMYCDNYINKCPLHGLYGEPTNKCSQEV